MVKKYRCTTREGLLIGGTKTLPPPPFAYREHRSIQTPFFDISLSLFLLFRGNPCVAICPFENTDFDLGVDSKDTKPLRKYNNANVKIV